MAQSPPVSASLSGETVSLRGETTPLRPLPRREKPAAPKVNRPRFMPTDAAWMGLLALLSVGLHYALHTPRTNTDWLRVALVAVTVLLTYLLGWRARDRATGMIAGLLLATSIPFAIGSGISPSTLVFTALVSASLFAFVAGSSLAALALAGLATVVQVDGVLLGEVLLVLSVVQRRKRAAFGTFLYLVISGVGWIALLLLHQHTVPQFVLRQSLWLPRLLIAPGLFFLAWFLLPLCAEFGEEARRACWQPIAAWAVFYGVVESVVRLEDIRAVSAALLPTLLVLVAGGISRLLPTLAGEFPQPGARYVLATLAVLTLVAARGRAEFPLLGMTPKPPISAAAPAKPVPAPVAAAPPAPVTPVPVPIPLAFKPTVPALKPAIKPIPPVKPAVKQAVKQAAAAQKPRVHRRLVRHYRSRRLRRYRHRRAYS